MADRPSIKDEETYDALRKDGASKEKAARIANANAKADPEQDPSSKGGMQPPYEDWTKDDLMERETELGIDGRSTMDKDALIDGLRSH